MSEKDKQGARVIHALNDYTAWTAFGNDTLNLADNAHGLMESGSLLFDKANGSNNKKYAGVYKTIDETDLFRNFSPLDRIVASFYVSATTNIDYLFLRLGDDSTNYFEWQWTDTNMDTPASTWNALSVKVGDAYIGGTGGDITDIDYMAFGVMFDAESNELTGMIFSGFYLERSVKTTT